MTRLLSCLGLLLVLAGMAGCKPAGPTFEAQWRFVGGDALQQQTNAPVLRDVLNLKESAAIRGLLLTNVAETLWALTTGETNTPASAVPPGAVVADGLMGKLTAGQMYSAGNGKRDWAVALPVEAANDSFKAAWTKFFGAAKPSGTPEVVVSGTWAVAVSDSKTVKPASVLPVLTRIPAEAGDALRLDLNLAGEPGVALVAKLQDGVVRMNAKLAFAGAEVPPSNLPKWQVPRLVREPLVQFAASRWPEPLVRRISWLNWLVGDSKPSQIVLWGNQASPQVPELRTYAAFMGLDPRKRFDGIVENLKPVFDVPESNAVVFGRIVVEPTLPRVSLEGLTLVTPPTLLVITNDVSPYLLAGTSRPLVSSNRPPAELFQQLEKPGLLFYQWEITGEALRNWVSTDQVNDLTFRRRSHIRGAVQRWVPVLAQHSELNTVTEATLTGDGQVSLVRKAPLGLTSMELTALAHWLGTKAPVDRMVPAGVRKR